METWRQERNTFKLSKERHLLRRFRRKENENEWIFQLPFKCSRILLEEKKNRKVAVTKQDPEEHIKSQLGNH